MNKLVELIKEYSNKDVQELLNFQNKETWYVYDGVHHPDVESLICEVFEIPNCGCGSPELMLKTIKSFLEDMDGDEKRKISGKYRKDDVETIEEGMMLLLLYWLDSKGYTEHGSTIYYSWPTSNGRILLECLKLVYNE